MTEIDLRLKTRQVQDDLSTLQKEGEERQTMVRLTIHDLRTPLNSLMLCLDVLPTMCSLNDDQHNFVKLCQRSGEALRALVDDLMDYEAVGQSGREALRMSRCDPKALAIMAMDQVVGLAKEKNISLERKIAEDLPAFQGDEHKLSRVLVNLLGNAIKFTGEKGRVCLSVSHLTDRKELHFAVEDTGIGFDPALSELIFKAGVRLDRTATTKQSTGLGLALCRRIVEAHRGTITTKSAQGEGSVFTVSLPLQS